MCYAKHPADEFSLAFFHAEYSPASMCLVNVSYETVLFLSILLLKGHFLKNIWGLFQKAGLVKTLS